MLLGGQGSRWLSCVSGCGLEGRLATSHRPAWEGCEWRLVRSDVSGGGRSCFGEWGLHAFLGGGEKALQIPRRLCRGHLQGL